MSIPEPICPACGHPVDPGDRYCGDCGAVLPGSLEALPPPLAPRTGSNPDASPLQPAVEFKPLDLDGAGPRHRRPFGWLAVVLFGTVACIVLLVMAEVALGNDQDRAFWIVTWLVSYAGTVVAAVGWFALLLRRWRQRQRQRPARGGLVSVH